MLPVNSAALYLSMNLQSSKELPSNKFMYVKQDFLSSIQQSSQPKVLINPNFMRVKPHFNKQFLLNQTIHINPNILKRNDSVEVVLPKVTKTESNVKRESQVAKPVPNKAIVTTPTKLIRVPQVKSAVLKNNLLVSTHSKLVRATKGDENKLTRRTSIHTKYKIIRHSPASKSIQKQKVDIKKLYYVKNQFRIDHRAPIKSTLSRKLIRSPWLNKSLNTTLTTKNVYVKCNSKLNKTQYVSINGILYRTSSKLLVNMNKKSVTNKINVERRHKLLTIRGQKYKLDSNHRTLTLLTRNDKQLTPNFKTICVGGITFKRKEPNVFVKTNANQKHVWLSQAKQRSINTLTNKMRKSNVPCPFYQRFGRCKGREKGTCIRIHNPDQISLCPKFLQGACVSDKCLLSHKVSAEKMPTCKFFLEGLCSKDDCPYLHVKINAKADICKDFLEGFCKKAAECDKRHQYLCPDFEKIGKCARRKCQYPHGNVVRKNRFSKTIASKLQASNEFGKVNTKNHPVSHHQTCGKNKINYKNSTAEKADSDTPEPEKALNIRYYAESVPNTWKEVGVRPKYCGEFEIVDLDLKQTDSSIVSPLKKRPTVGDLPSFIPFLDED